MELDKIRELVNSVLGIDKDIIKPETTFKEIECDSIDLYQIIMSLEEAYSVEFPAEDLENIQTVQDLINEIKKCKK